MRLRPRAVLVCFVLALSGCGALGAAEITVAARNDSDLPMIVQVVHGDGAEPYGPAHRVEPLDERDIELAVPGDPWTVTVNGAHLLTDSDAGLRRGRLPVVLILPAPDDPIQGPRWQAPADWAGGG